MLAELLSPVEYFIATGIVITAIVAVAAALVVIIFDR